MAIAKRTHSDGKSCSWQVLIDTRDAVSGKRKRVTIGTYRTKKEAERAERDAITARERGTLLDPSQTTVAELLDSWLASKAGEISPNSIADYELVVRKHLKPALGSIRVQALKPDRLQAQYATWRDAGMSARMIRGCHMRLSQALGQAVRFSLAPANVCDAVRPPKLSVTKTDVWNAREAARFLEAAESDWLWPLWPLLLLEGLRRGEALGLRWRDVNFANATATVVQTVAPDKAKRGAAIVQERTKTAAGARTLRLTPETLTALRELRTRWIERRLASSAWQDPFDLIVCTSNGGPINPANVTRSFTAIVKRAGLRRIRVYDLRHTNASLLLESGVSAQMVSQRLGHAGIGVTINFYGHVTPRMEDEAAGAFTGILARGNVGW
ncbi:MAG: site-specific integrase [Chloroflexota bacterium]|nr:site-specific integrase [Chloroflexota bacterium]